MNSALGAKVHALFRKEDLDGLRLDGKVVVVLDILFATSTIVTALSRGVTDVIPTMDEAAARARAAELPAGSYVTSGELYAETLPGFLPPTPLALLAHPVTGKTLVYSTTNGTVAVRQSAQAKHIFAGAMLNAQSLVDHIMAKHANDTVLILCSGSMGNVNLEDMVGAGYIVDLFARSMRGSRDFSDAAIAAQQLYLSADPLDLLMRSRVGKMMQDRNLVHEVEFAAQRSQIDLVPMLENGRLVAV